VINNLTPSTAYRVRVKARNSVGTSLASQVSAPLITQTPTAPGAPTAVSVSLATNTSVTLAFTAPGSNGGATIESYTAISTPDSVVAYSSGSSSGSVTLTGLRPGITYSFSVRAGNSAGRSLASNSLTLKIPKSPVLGTWPNISKNKSDAPFLLTPPSESYTAAGSFVYTSSNPGIVSISGETVTVVQSGSAVITATFYPSDTATYLSGVTKTMTISVSAALNSITFGSISSRALTSGKFNLAATALGGTITYTTSSSASICTVTNVGAVSMFSPGTCAITASTLGNANYGAATDVTQNLIITAAPPGAPTLTSVSVGGTDASTATSGYATLQFTANTENGGSITSYTLTATPATGSVITKTVNGAAGTRTESMTALSLGVAYTFSVTAYNGGTAGGGTSVASNSVSKTPAANPNAPTNLRVTSGNTTLTANWTPPASLGGGTWDSYRIFIKRSSDSSFPDTPTAVVETQTASSYVFTGLTNGVAYDIKIWVKTTSFTTELLANTAAVYLIPATVPSGPRLALAQTDSVTVSASWASNGDGGSALTGYNLTLSSGACSFSFVSGTTSYSCAISGLTPGVTITASLVASNQIGASTASTANINYVTVVGAPTSVVVTNGDGLASLAFSIDNGGDTIVSYDYSIDSLSYSPLNVTSSPITITGLTNDQTYDIYLRAKGATFGNGPSSSAIRVVPHLTVTTVTQTVATPAYLKAISYPFISTTGTSYICSRGEYQFVRSGGGVEAAKVTKVSYLLFINGTLVDSATSIALTVAFDKKELLEASTVSCSVILEQEGVVSQFKSIDNPIYVAITKAKNDSLKVATGIYQDARDSAYALRVEGNAASILAWRKSMDSALEDLSTAKDLAASTYVDALKKEGISIFTAALAVKAPVVPIEVKEPGTINVQPTKAMRKVGTIYFATGTSFVNDASRKTIEKLAIQIKSSGAKLVLSYGHTDSQGGVNNTLLSRSRSIAIAKGLRKLLPGVKISTGWFASTKPIAKGKSAADLAKNRRVEIYVK
jgi:outer membrane protein OmpA-like peptidoglycan-associated protein